MIRLRFPQRTSWRLGRTWPLAGAVAALVAALVLSAGSGWAQLRPPAPPSQPQQPEGIAQSEAIGTSVLIGVFLHELGHGVINELQLPAIGPEEDAADEFAAMVFVFNMRADPKFREMAIWMPRLWRGIAESDAQRGAGHNNFDEHAPDMIRYGKILCVMAGADPTAFADEVKASIPDEQQRARWQFRCERDFTRKWAAWNALLKPHRRNTNPKMPGDLPADAKGGKMYVDYSWLDVPMASDFTRKYGAVIRDSRVFDRVAENFTRDYVLPRDIPIYIRECDVYNAWYSPDAHSLSMCLNFAQYALEMLKPMIAQINAGGTSSGGRIRPPK